MLCFQLTSHQTTLMKRLISVLITIIVNLNWLISGCLGATLSDSGVTVPNSMLQIPATSITLKEISFKNTDRDFFTFQIQTDQEKINLRGLEFYDDQIFKTINEDFWVKNNDLIKLTFASASANDQTGLNIYSDKKGLTATTEQIIIKQGQYYFDFFCWKKDPISKAEASEFSKIWQNGFWDDQAITSCFDSSKLENNQTIIRLNHDHSSSAWKVKEDLSKVKTAITNGNKTPPKKTSSSSIIKLSNNEQLPANPSISITEIFPAPIDKNDSEWVEFKNLTAAPINLQNWIIDDGDGGSKPKSLGKLDLPALGYLAIQLKSLKINLNNSADQIRLFRPNGKLEASQSYAEVEKGKSYSLVTFDGQPEWQYVDSPTPGAANPIFNTIVGQITAAPDFGEIYSFPLQVQNSDNPANSEQYLVTFNEKIIKGPLAKSSFIPGATGSFTGQISIIGKNAVSQKVLQLNRFQIDLTPNPATDSPLLPIIAIIFLVCLAAYFIFQKYHSWARSQPGNYSSLS